MKILFVGILASGLEWVENLCEAPSLFDYDAIVVDADQIWPPNIRGSITLGETTEVRRGADFGEFSAPLSRRFDEARLLLEKGGIMTCLMRPVTIVGYRYWEVGKERYASVSNYDWLPIKSFRNYVVAGNGVRTRKIRSSPFDNYLKLKELEWLAYCSKGFQPSQLEIIVTNDAGLAVAAKVPVGSGSVYLLPIAKHEKLPEILVSDLAKAFKIKTFRPAPPWISGIHVPDEDEIGRKLRSVREEIAEIKSREAAFERQLEERTFIKLLLYEKGDVLHDVVERVLNELGFMVKREGDNDLVSNKDPAKRVVFEVTGTEGTIDVDKLRQLVDYVVTEEKSTGKLPKSVLIGNHQIDLDPRERSTAFTDKAVQQSKVYGTCLLPSEELFKAIVAFRESKLDATQFWDAIISTVEIFSLTNKPSSSNPSP